MEKKKQQIITFSDLVSLVKIDENTENVLKNNLSKSSEYKGLVQDKYEAYLKIKELLPSSASFFNIPLYISAYVTFLFSILSICVLMFSITPLIALSSISCIFCIFYSYSTYHKLKGYANYKFPHLPKIVNSLNANDMLNTLRLHSTKTDVNNLPNPNSFIYKIVSKINFGSLYSCNSKILEKFSELSYVPSDYSSRKQKKIEKANRFMELLTFFNQTKIPDNKLGFFYKNLYLTYLPFIAVYLTALFKYDSSYIAYAGFYAIFFIVFNLFLNYFFLNKKEDPSLLDYYLKKEELHKFIALPQLKESLIIIGLVEPEFFLSLRKDLDVDDLIKLIKNLDENKQNQVITSLTKIINTPLKEYENPLIFN